MGIEPTSSAWKAEVLPLNYTRRTHLYEPGESAFNKTWPLPEPANTDIDPASATWRKWWRGEDSNLRRLSQQIYSLPSLTA